MNDPLVTTMLDRLGSILNDKLPKGSRLGIFCWNAATGNTLLWVPRGSEHAIDHFLEASLEAVRNPKGTLGGD